MKMHNLLEGSEAVLLCNGAALTERYSIYAQQRYNTTFMPFS